jgi:hypothetical protein
MTPTYHIPSIIAVLIAIIVAAKFRKIIRSFTDSGSTSPKSSKTREELNLRQGFIFNRLINRGVIIETNPESYYLNKENLAEYKKTRRKRIMIFLGVLIVLILLDMLALKYF